MPRWRALPDELDPQVREFASQLRRLVDRSGLSVAAVADRTGYSKTSWERYLNGRLLAPKGAIVALAEVTGTNPVHLTTMWELAERAWSRSEMRHDMTMEAIRISQARAALGELGPTSPKAKGGSRGKPASKAAAAAPPKPAGAGASAPPRSPSSGGDAPTSFLGRLPQKESSGTSGSSSSAGGASSGASGRSGTSTPGGPSAPRTGSWGVAPPSNLSGSAGLAGKSGQSAWSGQSGSSGQSGYSAPTGPSGPTGGPPEDARPPRSGGSPDAQRRKRRVTMFLAGVVGALVVIAAALYLTDPGGKGGSADEAKPSPTPSVSKNLPSGVQCSGKDCTGQDPENMGCGGELATTTDNVTVGTALIEVRYSKTCGAAWARITQATVGDEVQISSSGAAEQTGKVKVDTDTYTPMVAVKDAGDAKACATLASGEEGCTASAG
ncbi:XRE family transcriptional regulator [Streptomyces sp. NPDC048825]|uniref:XRE family transcriptional regulator n=1 Tax=Streptomyces sp. NPDC048825 TaxID=3365592 RepID=UPI00371C6661